MIVGGIAEDEVGEVLVTGLEDYSRLSMAVEGLTQVLRGATSPQERREIEGKIALKRREMGLCRSRLESVERRC